MKKTPGPVVSIVMGSDSDLPVMKEAADLLKQFAIPFEFILTSAHRSPERTMNFAAGAAKRGIKVIIVGAGAAAHLAGVISSITALPVIGVPIEATSLGGLDALLSTVQMPGGVPVSTMAIGRAGAKNAAITAARILALEDARLRRELKKFSDKMAAEVERKQERLNA
jgi:phosphoribosylaminoimidazole carboxylase PurE protein